MQENPVVRQIQRAVRAAIPQGSQVVVAVSGGADSMALAAAVQSLVQEKYCRAQVVHVEHGLRGQEALADARLVADFCNQYQLPYACEHVRVRQLVQQEKLSVEDAARRLRYQVLYRWLDRLQADYLLTAHHRDDQAETVLLKLFRGAGLEGLAAMAPQQGKLLRPFLNLPRTLLKSYCAIKNINYCYDSSNADLHYSRNRVRQELLPYLEKYFNPAIRQQLAQTAKILQEDADYLEDLAAAKLRELGSRQPEGWILQTTGWSDYPQSLRKRILRQAYFYLTKSTLSYDLTESLDSLCLDARSGRSVDLPQRIRADYAYGELRMGKAQSQQHSSEFRLELSCREGDSFQFQGKQFNIKLVEGSFPGLQLPGIIYPWALVAEQPLCLRSRLSGDRFHPYGVGGGKKLKDYFIDKKIPRSTRDEQILLCTPDRVLGIFGLANGAWPLGEYHTWLLVECRSI